MELTFPSEYLNEFFDTDENQALRAFAREYHVRTEAFDQIHCSLRNKDGIAIPAGYQNHLSAQNARDVRTDIIQRERLNYIAFYKAIRDDARSFDQDWCAGLYDHLKYNPTYA